MIEGMEVLKQTDITVEHISKDAWILLVIGIVIGIVFLILSIRQSARERFYYDRVVTGAPFFFGVVAFAAICSGCFLFEKKIEDVPTGRYEYEVILDDTVDMKEIYEQYEVIDSKGNIYVLRDRELAEDICNECGFKFNKNDKFCSECGTKR